ncbi:HNH endonuclease signature motif containing protein [Neorhizobium tomejilense]|uniref:HNH endonuclease signature motif containing protein n=1 Tax=Neorhizobium tomejilense TaxID=2093828 RepID=UPI000CFA6FF8|nr:HNH endonuclease [Neorhizobium tomejilense]
MPTEKPTREFFDRLDKIWDRLEPHLLRTFTTQHFRQVVEVHAPEVWATFVERWGPGGKGSGNYYSPSNPLNNYLKDKVRNAELINAGFVDSTEGWGARWVNQWQFLDVANLPPSEEDLEFSEGKPGWKLHLVRERHAGARASLLKARAGSIFCDICGETGDHLSEDIRNAMFEAHHATKPVSDGERKTKLKDLALLCASCHRLIHKLVAIKGDWVDINEAKRSLLKNG